MFKFLKPNSPNYYLRCKRRSVEHENTESFKEKNPQDIFMRPRLVQERVLLEKLRKHADELVSPPEPTPPTPPSPKVVKEKVKSPVPSVKSSIIKSTSESDSKKDDAPSPLPIKKSEIESESFLASVVKSAQDLNIDLGSISTTSINVEPEKKKKPDVTVSRSHTVAITPQSEQKSSKPKKTISHEMPRQSVTSVSSTLSSEKSSNPAMLNPAQLQALQKMRGIKPKMLTKTPPLPHSTKKILKSSNTVSEASSAATSPKLIKSEPTGLGAMTVVEPSSVAVNYRTSNPYGIKVSSFSKFHSPCITSKLA